MAGPDLAADHPLDRAIALVAARADDPRCLSGATSEDYWNAVGPFGGVTAATLLNAVLLQPDRLGVPLSLTVSYAGAIRAGGFEIRVRLLRGGRTTQHWSVDLVQGPADEVLDFVRSSPVNGYTGQALARARIAGRAGVGKGNAARPSRAQANIARLAFEHEAIDP